MYFNHDKFVSVNKVPTEYDEIKELIENHKNAMEDTLSKLWKYILSFVRKKIGIKNSRGRRIKQNRLLLVSNYYF